MSESAALLARLISNLPGMAYRCLHDADWTLEFVSDGSTELLGYAPQEFLDRRVSVTDLIHADDLARVSLDLETALSEKRPFSLSYRMRTASGEEKHISEVGRGILGPDGSLEALEGFLLDATARVTAEADLRAAQRRETIGRLAGGIAHDFTNLLTTLYGASVHLLRNTSEDDPKQRTIQSIITVADKAKELTRQLIDLERPPPVGFPSVDLGGILESQRQLLSELVGRSITLDIASELESSPVAIDPNRFEQLILNLVCNARDAIDGAGTIDVRLTQCDDQALLEVRDDGGGMTPEVRRQVFDPFFTTKLPNRGTGLGMAIVQSVVHDAGGRIDVESRLGEGTVFRVFLPLTTRTVPTDLPHDLPIGSEVVLLVEDQEEVRFFLAQGLRRLGYTVLEAANGQQALSLSHRHKGPIDLLVTDAKMPQLGGLELATAFQRDRPDTLRILITGDSVTPADGLFQAVLRKPIQMEPFGEVLRSVINERPMEPENYPTIG